jgi:hypothetical protein
MGRTDTKISPTHFLLLHSFGLSVDAVARHMANRVRSIKRTCAMHSTVVSVEGQVSVPAGRTCRLRCCTKEVAARKATAKCNSQNDTETLIAS